MHADADLKQILVRYFCQFKDGKLSTQQSAMYLESFFNLILQMYLPKQQFLGILSKSTILTHQQVDQFQGLFDTAKKLQYLILISDYWMVNNNDTEHSRNFLRYIGDLTNFFYSDYNPNIQGFVRKADNLNFKKQLFMNSLGVHRLILQLLEKNAYLVSHIQLKKDLPKKYKQIFEACFSFLLCFIKKCGENKHVLYEYFPILLLYQSSIQMGQLAIYTQFYTDEKNFIKEINFSFIEKTILRIIKSKGQSGKNENCEYTPDYINLIIVMLKTLNVEGRTFVEQLSMYIVKPDIFFKLLYLEENKKSSQANLCLKMQRIKLQPIQLPLLYHSKLLQMFNLMLQYATETIRNKFKIKLIQTFKVNYFFTILSLPDIFSNTGIEPQLNFIVKEQIFPLLMVFLEKNQLFSEIYQSQTLYKFLQFINKNFSKSAKRTQLSIQNESESFFPPFMQNMKDYAENIETRMKAYYNTNIKPFVAKLSRIFEKQTQSKITSYITLLQQTLNETFKKQLLNHNTMVSSYQLEDVKMKWRNFVDDDQDNSKEEQYVKKQILDILKSRKAADIINEELQKFYLVIKANSKQFIGSMIRLLKILFSSKDIFQGRKQESKTVAQVLRYLSGYIQYNSKHIDEQSKSLDEINKIIKILEECKFVQIFIELSSKKQFQLRKIHLKNIFVYCLNILNFLLRNDKQLKFSRLLMKTFKQMPQSYKFLQFLEKGALEIISTLDPHNHLQQINSALSEMKLCVDIPPLYLHEQTYLTLSHLCKYEPFTQYLRNQQSAFVDTDFMDKIYNILLFIFNNHNDQSHLSRTISVSTVRATEQILNFVSSMLTGANKSNQNYVMDNKFTNFVQNILKMDTLKAKQYEFQNERQDLLNKIIDFYKQNGIDIEQLLKSKIRLIDFRQIYLLNRFKTVLMKTLLQCLIDNENGFQRLKMDMSVEVIKLNLIWVYEEYKKKKHLYTQELIIKQRVDWLLLVEKDYKVEPLFLRLGFYCYQLIELYEEKGAEADNAQNDEKIINEQKQKERVVKKFFSTIKENHRQKAKQRLLQSELAMKQQMKYYYHMYYNAMIFFKKKTGTIQVDLKGSMIKVYFPKLPITEQITEDMQKQFQIGVNRLSRDQKIKSLMQFQNRFYQDLKGEQDYFRQVERRMPFFGPVIKMMKYESEFMLAALVTSILICILYLLQDFLTPNSSIINGLFQFIKPGAGSGNFIILLLSLTNLFIGLIIGIYLFTRKIPLRKKLLSLKFQQNQRKDKQQLKNKAQSKTFYIWKNIFLQIIYNLIIVIILILNMIHPFFSAFVLVEIINRIQMGRFIIRSIKQTWNQLFVAVGLIVVFNLLSVQIVYNFFTTASAYGKMCQSQYTCFLLFFDQIFKGGEGVMGNIPTMDYINNQISISLIFQIIYILIACKVFFQIFSGTLIDKFSQLREEEQNIAEDKNTICFICGQERFDLDLEYQGFVTHTEQNHEAFNYIRYLFFLRRQQERDYGIIERYISDLKLKDSQKWIPEQNSVFKQAKQRRESQQVAEQDVKEKVLFICKEKVRDFKRIKQKLQNMGKDLRKQSRSPVK